MKLYHATLKSNLDSIRELGLNPQFSQGAEKVIWMHTASRREWAILHVQKRHKCTLDDVIVIEIPFRDRGYADAGADSGQLHSQSRNS